MAEPGKSTAPNLLDEDAKLDFQDRKAKRKYRNQVRKFRRNAETDNSELNLTAMMDMMTILLVFLIKSYGATQITVAMGKDLTPPTSISTLRPIDGTTTITLTEKDVSVMERGVIKLDHGKIPADAMDSKTGLIPKVKAELEKEVLKNALLPPPREKGAKMDPVQMLTVIADKELPYETLYHVLKTAGRLDIDRSKGEKPLKFFKFLVLSNS